MKTYHQGYGRVDREVNPRVFDNIGYKLNVPSFGFENVDNRTCEAYILLLEYTVYVRMSLCGFFFQLLGYIYLNMLIYFCKVVIPHSKTFGLNEIFE